MATTTNLTWLPADLRGLPAFPSNGMLYIYKPSANSGEKVELRAMIPAKSHLVIEFPKGTTISGDIPVNSIGTEQIKDGTVQMEDLDPAIVTTPEEARDIVAKAIANTE